MTTIIRASGALNQDTFEGAISVQEDGSDEVVIDLGSCFFVDPFSMVTMLTIAAVARSRGASVRLRVPDLQNAGTYLGRMRFFTLLPDEVQLDRVPPVIHHPTPRWLVELNPINMNEGERGIDRICNFVWEQLPGELREGFVEALAEIGTNVIAHSEATVGFLAGQRFEKAYRGRNPPRLQLVVADAGIGIKASFAALGPIVQAMPDESVIEEAVKAGVTSKPNKHSGVGLSTVLRYADMFDGVLRIRSGSGLFVRKRGRQVTRQLARLPGTIVAVELSSPGRSVR